jgi:hypothetical protein
MDAARSLLFSIFAVMVTGCGGNGPPPVFEAAQSMSGFSVTSNVYLYDLARSQGCELAVAYSRIQSNAQAIPQVEVHGVKLVRENETLRMDYTPIKTEHQGGDLWVTATACSTSNNFAPGERLSVVLHVTVEGIGTLDVKPPATSLMPAKHPPPSGGRKGVP